jgi:hypothetical protein
LPWNAPLNGTPLKRALRGTARTVSALGKRANGIFSAVRSAVASIVHPIRRDPSSVILIARWRACEGGEEGPLVYDLTVEKHHCYLANGILVSNCDSFRYLALSWRPLPPRKLRVNGPMTGDTGWRIPPVREYNERWRGGIEL